MLLAFLAGTLAGAVHVVSGPDHLVAVIPFSIRGQGRAWRVGLSWGIGHTLGVAAIGALALLLRGALPLEAISARSEQLVGVVLVLIGLWTVRSALRHRVHAHPHDHDGVPHVHFHIHRGPQAHDATHAHDHDHAPLGVGALHGLAGSAHLVGVLPALALPTTASAVSYLAGYGAGTIGAMTVFAHLVGRMSGRLSGHGPEAVRHLMMGAGVLAVAVGVVWLVP